MFTVRCKKQKISSNLFLLMMLAIPGILIYSLLFCQNISSLVNLMIPSNKHESFHLFNTNIIPCSGIWPTRSAGMCIPVIFNKSHTSSIKYLIKKSKGRVFFIKMYC